MKLSFSVDFCIFFRNTESMLPKLDENPPDTSQVIDTPSHPLPTPKHSTLRLFLYLLLGLVVFIVLFIIATWGILYYFKTDLKSFLLDTKSDAYQLSRIKNPQISPTISPTKNAWSTYTNSIHHYSILYPTDWTIEQDTDESIILYPPGSFAYASLTQADIGAGLGPRMSITVITRPYFVPDSEHMTVITNSGVSGYSYINDSNSDLPIVDFPIHNNSNILEFQAHNIGQENINDHIKSHKSDIVVKDIDQTSFEKIVKSVRFTQ